MPSTRTPRRLALIGLAGHGKNSVGDILETNHGFRQSALADPIKEMLAVGLGIDRSCLYGNDAAKSQVIPHLGKSPRELLLSLGTEWGREQVEPDVWTKILLSRLPSRASVVVTDVRFPSEVNHLREAGFIIARVVRPSYKAKADRASTGHISEAGQADILCDLTIFNSGTLENLEALVLTLIKSAFPSQDSQ